MLASTCAFGSQKCRPKTGILTKKGKTSRSSPAPLKENIFNVNRASLFKNKTSPVKKGRDVVAV